MQNKNLLIITFSLFLGCASEKDTKLQNAVNIFNNDNKLLSIISIFDSFSEFVFG